MRIACLSDLHLGFRGAGRSENGRNVREVDVEAAWHAAVERIIEQRPDLVTIAGDMFDTVVPSTHAKDAFLTGLSQLPERLPVAIVGGNHESPRTVGVLSPNALSRHLPGTVRVLEPGEVWERRTVDGEERFAVHGYGYSCLGRPDVRVPEPVPGAINILLLHAAVRSSAEPDALPQFYGGPGAYDVALADGFDVVPCGDFHDFRLLCRGGYTEVIGGEYEIRDDTARRGAPLAFYSGSIERTSSNIWQETAPKGFVLVDTSARTVEFVPVPTRTMLAYDLADFEEPSAESLNRYLAHIAAEPEVDGALVRLLAADFPRSQRDAIDWALVRQLKQRCVLFHPDVRTAVDEAVELGDRRHRQAQTLDELVDEFAADAEPAVRARMRHHLGLGEPVLAEVVHA